VTHPVWTAWDKRFLDHHGPPGHPESPERLDAVAEGIRSARSAGLELLDIEGHAASDETLLRAHTAQHIAQVRTASQAGEHLDGDTYTTPASDAVARLAVGTTLAVCRAVLDGTRSRAGFAAVRPPGHHAERHRAMGFCLYANVAAAALELLDTAQVTRVAVVDWDVHHGNGTQDVLWDRADALMISLHQWPLYPGTGEVLELGGPNALGRTVNAPMPPGCTDADYALVFEHIIVPLLARFDPGLIIVSCGFDAHHLDPLANMRLTSGMYGVMAHALASLEKPLAVVLEGGYNLVALREGTSAVLSALSGAGHDGVTGDPSSRAVNVVARMAAALSPHWPGLFAP
jgi:acetoin utilization deacetylase AcuC-like enzyme